jgi:hypothetical protein
MMKLISPFPLTLTTKALHECSSGWFEHTAESESSGSPPSLQLQNGVSLPRSPLLGTSAGKLTESLLDLSQEIAKLINVARGTPTPAQNPRIPDSATLSASMQFIARQATWPVVLPHLKIKLVVLGQSSFRSR